METKDWEVSIVDPKNPFLHIEEPDADLEWLPDETGDVKPVVVKFEAGLIPVIKYNHAHDAKTGEFATSDGSDSSNLVDLFPLERHMDHGKFIVPKKVGDLVLSEKIGFTTYHRDGSSSRLGSDIGYEHPNGSQVIIQDLEKTKLTTGKIQEFLQLQSDIMAKYPIPNATIVVQSGAKVQARHAGGRMLTGGVIPKNSDGVCFSGESLKFKNGFGTPASTHEVQRYFLDKGLPAPISKDAPYISIRARVLDVSTKEKTRYTNTGTITYEGWHPAARTVHLKEVVTHEWGHALDKRPDAIADAQFRNRNPKSTSNYGNKNGREFFAETFTAHELGGLAQDKPDSVPNYAQAVEHLGIASLREKVSKADENVGFICYDDFEGGNPVLVTDGKPLESDDYEDVTKFNQNHDGKTGKFSSSQSGVASGSESQHLKFSDAYSEQGFLTPDTADEMGTESEMTSEQFNNLVYYQSNGYEVINPYLRTGMAPTLFGVDPHQEGAYLDAKIASIDDLISRLPQIKLETPLYRVFPASAITGLKVGQVYQDKGYLSATTKDISAKGNKDLRQALGGLSSSMDVVARIIPNGHYSGASMNDLVAVKRYAHEEEFLMPRDTQIKYLGFEKAPSGETIMNFQRMNG